jgi:hypothetical protein
MNPPSHAPSSLHRSSLSKTSWHWGLLILSAGWALAQDLRTWTDVQGRTLKAALMGVTEQGVQLRLENGTVSTVPFDRLSPEDRQYLSKQPKSDPAATPTTPSTPSTPSAAWPSDVALKGVPEVTTVKEDVEAGEFIYQTEHYEFRCDAKLGASVVREFARLFEATHLVNHELPLNLSPKPESGQEKFLALLFKDKQDYYNAGAIPGSAGVYMGGKKCLMVPMESLGVRQVGKRFSLDRDSDNTTLIHEITHQMMNHWIPNLPTWYVEGSAEYVAAAKYRQGRFAFTRMGDNVVAYLRENKGVWDKKWTMWHLHHLMQIDGEAWSGAIGSDKTVSMRNYASSAILTFYFYHLDDAGDGKNLVNYLKDIKAGTLQRLAAQRHLIRGRSYAAIEKELAQKMRRWGLDLEFTGDAGPEFPESTKTADKSTGASEGEK